MDENLIRQKLQNWMVNFVEKSNKSLNNWPPCPYAKQARLRNQIHIVFDSPLHVASYTHLLDQFEVIVLCFDHTKFSASQVTLFTQHVNSILVWKDCVVLEDHPNAEELINGVKMNFEECGLMIMQRLSKLNTAADQLRDKGYYETWSKENLDQVVNWRHDIC